MRIINSREARAKWRELLDEVQTNNSQIIVERYGKPICMLVPYPDTETTLPSSKKLQEPGPSYSVSVAEAEEDKKRAALISELQTMPIETLETAVQLLKILQQTQLLTPIVPVEPILANEWKALLESGYQGDALKDSEAFYE